MLNEKWIIEAAKDGFKFESKDVQEVMTFLQERKEHVKVTKVDSLATIPVFPCDTRIFPEEYTKHNLTNSTMPNNIGYSQEEAFEETCKNVGMLVTATNGYDAMLVRPEALSTMCDATEAYGRGWKNVLGKNRAIATDLLNGFYQCKSGGFTLVEEFGKILNVASKRYVYLPQDELFQSFLIAGVDKNGELADFNFSHEITYATIEFPPEEAQKYALDALKFDKNNTKLRMYMCTSDCRSSSARVWIELTDDNKSIVALGVNAVHKGQNAISRFSEACMSCCPALETTSQRYVDLDQIVLQYGESTIRTVGKRAGISDKLLVKEIREAKKKGLDFNGLTAYEGYLFLSTVVDASTLNKSKKKGYGNSALFDNYIKTDIKARIGEQHWREIDADSHYDELEPEDAVLVSKAEEPLPGQIDMFDQLDDDDIDDDDIDVDAAV